MGVQPKWCPHRTCQFLRSGSDAVCCGRLSSPEEHDGDMNTHRICFQAGGDVMNFQVNRTDVWWLTRTVDAIRLDSNEPKPAKRE
jgi:hypothetical protein